MGRTRPEELDLLPRGAFPLSLLGCKGFLPVSTLTLCFPAPELHIFRFDAKVVFSKPVSGHCKIHIPYHHGQHSCDPSVAPVL